MLFGISRPQLCYLMAIAWTIIIFVGCSIPNPTLPDVPGKDKGIHIAIFILFGLFWRLTGRSWWWVLVAGTVYGSLIEVWQAVMPIGRSGDVKDALADVAGTALGAALGWIVNKAVDRSR